MTLVCGVVLAAVPGSGGPDVAATGQVSGPDRDHDVTTAADLPMLDLGGTAPGREGTTDRDGRTNRSGGRTAPDSEKQDSEKQDSEKKSEKKDSEKSDKKQPEGSGRAGMNTKVVPKPTPTPDPESNDSDGGSGSEDGDSGDSGDSGNGSSGSTAPCPSGSSVEQGLVPNAIKVHRDVCHRWPQLTNYGGVRPDSMPEHPSGRALDIMISSNATGWEVARYLRANAGRLGVSQVIFDQKIWTVQRSGEGWRWMSDRGGATANHRDHVHVTVYG